MNATCCRAEGGSGVAPQRETMGVAFNHPADSRPRRVMGIQGPTNVTGISLKEES